MGDPMAFKILSYRLLSPASVEAAVMCEPCVVEATAIEISPVVSFEERTVVIEVETIPVVTVPGRIVIVSIAGEIRFEDGGGRIVSACVYGSGSDITTINYGCRGDKGPANNGESDTYMPESDASADINLGITFGSDEAAGYDGGENK
jgi:hypothetical protein